MQSVVNWVQGRSGRKVSIRASPSTANVGGDTNCWRSLQVGLKGDTREEGSGWGRKLATAVAKTHSGGSSGLRGGGSDEFIVRLGRALGCPAEWGR